MCEVQVFLYFVLCAKKKNCFKNMFALLNKYLGLRGQVRTRNLVSFKDSIENLIGIKETAASAVYISCLQLQSKSRPEITTNNIYGEE